MLRKLKTGEQVGGTEGEGGSLVVLEQTGGIYVLLVEGNKVFLPEGVALYKQVPEEPDHTLEWWLNEDIEKHVVVLVRPKDAPMGKYAAVALDHSKGREEPQMVHAELEATYAGALAALERHFEMAYRIWLEGKND